MVHQRPAPRNNTLVGAESLFVNGDNVPHSSNTLIGTPAGPKIASYLFTRPAKARATVTASTMRNTWWAVT